MGKSELARAAIRARLDAPELEVPSPTFTLVQSYEAPGLEIWHVDLYRLGAPDEALELGLEEAHGEGALLIEWPERLGGLLPATRLDIRLAPGDAGGRIAQLGDPEGAWADRIAGLLA
jgi:tRNA threonylcarbamoyladenosine biosynthesis protein TsaE